MFIVVRRDDHQLAVEWVPKSGNRFSGETRVKT
ncbi:MAG: hypothetical protein JWO83_4851, partial [Caulobacteraceae bacterium]|nr:hypothetical protein [Caulobacteraceae bacterium]